MASRGLAGAVALVHDGASENCRGRIVWRPRVISGWEVDERKRVGERGEEEAELPAVNRGEDGAASDQR